MTTLRRNADDTVVIAVTEDVDSSDVNQLNQLFADVRSVVDIDPQTGAGPIPSFQLIQLAAFTARNVLTRFDPTSMFDFVIAVDGRVQTFTLSAVNWITYQDVIDDVNARLSGAQVTYVSQTPDVDGSHRMRITSNSQTIPAGGSDGSSFGTVSSIRVTTFLGEGAPTANIGDVGESATVTVSLDEYGAEDVLTGLDELTEYSMTIVVGQTPHTINATGAQVPTYQDVVDMINGITDTNGDQLLTATYRTTFPRANQISVVGSVDTSTIELSDFTSEPNPTAAFTNALLVQEFANFTNTVVLSSVNMLNSMTLTHDLGIPVHGGLDLADVIRYTYRADRLTHREVIPIEWSGYWWGWENT